MDKKFETYSKNIKVSEKTITLEDSPKDNLKQKLTDATTITEVKAVLSDILEIL